MSLTIEDVLTRGVQQVLPNKDGLAQLMTERKISLYQGFDPSAPSLHLGNFVGLMKLRQFQKLGHKVIFLVGDFSGMIGDPTDKLAARKKLTREQVLENAKLWKKQASMILDFDGDNPAQIVFNSAWLDKLSFKDVIEIASNFTVQQLIERDMFQERIKNNEPIYLHEFLYPVVTGYDSVALKVDLEIGGNDQMFNILVGRTLEKTLINKEKFALSTKLLVDKDGKKAGKTTGNALFLDSTPENFYGGIMSFPDEVIYLSYELLTELPLGGIEEKIKNHPMEEKKRLAWEIVKFLWGESKANNAKVNFESTIQNKDVKNIKVSLPVLKLKTTLPIISVLTEKGLVPSKSEFKRLVDQKAIEVDGKIIDNINQILVGGEIIKIGKSRFAKIVKE